MEASWSIIVEPLRSGLVENYCGSIIADPRLRSGLVEGAQGKRVPAGSDVSITRQIREWSSLRSGGSQNTHYVIPCGCDGHLTNISSMVHRWDALCHFMHDADTISRADTADTSTSKNIEHDT